jgi:23S rRNA (cytosine1962-C5)-methyltransferase
VVDRFGDVLVAQINTAGMERVKGEIVEALMKTLKPKTIIFRNDTGARKTEGLSAENEIAHGTAPEHLQLEENGTLFEVPTLEGQKTGWFFDHRISRARMQHLVKDKSVLDVFSYMGGWGVQAAVAGATEVTCLDSSARAIDFVHHNAGLNKVDDTVTSIQGDATEALQALREERKKYDVIVLDPPAFIKRKKDRSQGISAYQRLNQKALQCLNKDGILISASCSFHLQRDELIQILLKASRHVDRSLQIVDQGHQGPDHPIHPAIPETEYLKTFFARVNPV